MGEPGRLPSLPESGRSAKNGSPLVSASPLQRIVRTSPEGVNALDFSNFHKNSKPAIFKGAVALSPARKVQKLLMELLDQLDSDWKNIRSLNLGVKSGTGVVDDLSMHTIQVRVQELNMLCIHSDEASQAMEKLAPKLTKNQLQQLQVLFDMTGNEYLADYVRVCVFNTLSPLVKEPVDLVPMPKQGRKKKPTTAPSVKSQQTMRTQRSTATPGRHPERDEVLRFAGFLPESHPLSKKAYSLYNSRLPKCRASDTNVPFEDLSAADADARKREYCAKHGVRDSLHEEFYGAIPQPVEEPIPMFDSIQERWKATTCTTIKDEILSSTIMIGDSLPAWAKVPEYKTKYLADVEAKKLKAVQQATGGRLASRQHPSVSGYQNVFPSPGSPLPGLKPIFADSESEATTPLASHRAA